MFVNILIWWNLLSTSLVLNTRSSFLWIFESWQSIMLVKWSWIAYTSPFSIPPDNFLTRPPIIPSVFGRQKVADALMNTISSLDKFEQGVKDCLEAWQFRSSSRIRAFRLCGQGLIDIFPFQRWFLLDFFFLSAWFLLPLFMVFFVKSLIEARYLYHSISQLEQISLVMRSSLVFCLLFCISCGIHVQGQEALSLSLCRWRR